ncbi:hypothetical protein [Methylobacter tundripaludum]|uniref:hypothetical protein n=1 Tax=Methylobacter tundripaludum TaxID=173365 RepID=UPI0004DF4AC5|nr:hypothetical protein [Methylobacter tundripaludum]
MLNETLSAQYMAINFSWKTVLNKPECIAILYAVHCNYRDNKSLLRVLPQFQPNRLEAALTTLIAYQLVEVHLDKLILADDAIRLDQLVQADPLIIPRGGMELGVLQYTSLLDSLGINNPGLAINTLWISNNIPEEV